MNSTSHEYVNTVHPRLAYKYNDQVPDHEKIVYNMSLNKSHSQATHISPPTQPDHKCAIPENVLIIPIITINYKHCGCVGY